ncbi:hypothetical protein A2662_02220 [Candidatus Giovannonibacteria bacterium RIFCSPHIGHO2_01_FULL_45_33]|uniref:Response regulatory domain-containing protein n=1 Tax=Candidatus Giovannonibacteria bacterium RIFCSPLOWO2_01_FULL_45_34 TaxID=1798351 RepID=A0A1F5WZ45_9BACT|nr:MAG: hypothetical protein A2662_02220 [Candidatus Giovannonibacteria bacterium RIFCSPHIGHO2_01_FULL_45_33]OGF69383.1 MAG: hypothetical protein A3C73_02770 [Candidatus Giovannonibacteria bacterium RIFCSPHIGHO2_02_FULL_44_11]OGF80910.1 MAG: hypothetical protein A2930_04205 [Candidatus Giovannonibacteria bacterium RIFCSPLOWO2_01_FULL_45_34]
MAKNKILIVEDEMVHLNVMKAKLEYEGYQIVTATDGETGYKMLDSEKPDLVLLDIMLPKMNGFEFLAKAKEEGKTGKIPIIVVSNSGQPVEIDKALKLGAKDYLIKAEFNPSDVLEKAETVLGLSPRKQVAANNKATPVSAASISPAGKDAKSGKTKILIVEDDKFLRDLILQKLQREGFDTVPALDGEEGLKLAKEKMPDLVLLDLILPGLDGFEVLKQIKADAQTKQIPVIVLSNLGQKEDMDRAFSGGAEEFMVKANFTPGEIIAKIKQILQKKYF